MIVIRFFTGVTIKYPQATGIRKHPDGSTEIYKGSKDEPEIMAVLQSTAGAVIERNDYGRVILPVHETTIKEKELSLWEKVFGHKGNE